MTIVGKNLEYRLDYRGEQLLNFAISIPSLFINFSYYLFHDYRQIEQQQGLWPGLRIAAYGGNRHLLFFFPLLATTSALEPHAIGANIELVSEAMTEQNFPSKGASYLKNGRAERCCPRC